MTDKYKIQNDVGFFAETDDDIDDLFLSQPRYGGGGNGGGGAGYGGGYFESDNSGGGGGSRLEPMTEVERRQQQLMADIDRIQQRTLDSSKRSLRMVNESEQVGVATAEELMHQRERLENCSEKVTEIDRSLRTSQKHINSIKSIFGGFRNMFTKTPPAGSGGGSGGAAAGAAAPVEEAPSRRSVTQGSGVLAQAMQESQRSSTGRTDTSAHPALRLRGQTDEEEVDQMANGRSYETDSRARFKAAENQLDDNLDDLSSGLARLKGLAIGLGSEIEDQNLMLDKLSDAVEHSDIGIKRQNKQMSQILKK